MNSKEYTVKGYYDTTSENYFDPILGSKVVSELVFGGILFNNDLSRIEYAYSDMAFRRRLETTGKGSGVGKVVDLELPFAVFSQAGTPTEDDRPNAMNFVQANRGFLDIWSNLRIQAQAIKIPFELTAFYSRRDDADRAFQKIWWVMQPKAPIWVNLPINYFGRQIDVPVNITIDSCDIAPEYPDKQKQFLTQAEIYPVLIKFNVYTYLLRFDEVDPRFHVVDVDNNARVDFAESLIFEWASKKQHIYSHIEGEEKTDTTTENEDESVTISHEMMSDGSMKEIIKGSFCDNRHCTLVKYEFKDGKIKWAVKPEEEAYFESIRIVIPRKCNELITDVSIHEFTPPINENSAYKCTLILSSKDGNKLTYNLSIGDNSLTDIVGDSFFGLSFDNR